MKCPHCLGEDYWMRQPREWWERLLGVRASWVCTACGYHGREWFVRRPAAVSCRCPVCRPVPSLEARAPEPS